MDKITIQGDLRRHFGHSGLTVLVYYFILNATVTVALLAEGFVYFINQLLNPNVDYGDITDRLMGNGWGYLLACIIGGIILLCWKKPRFCFRDIWRREKPMTGKAFFVQRDLCSFPAVNQDRASLIADQTGGQPPLRKRYGSACTEQTYIDHSVPSFALKV